MLAAYGNNAAAASSQAYDPKQHGRAEKQAVYREWNKAAMPHPRDKPGDRAVRHDERNDEADPQDDPPVSVDT